MAAGLLLLTFFAFHATSGNQTENNMSPLSELRIYVIVTAFAHVPPIINTIYGPVRGEAIVLNTNKTLVQYLGIPFAQANRFEAPKSPKLWTRTVNATSFGMWCPQNPSVTMNSTEDMGEDCLSINVFLPEDKAKQNPALLPVMLWIHGGGFHSGGSAAGLFNGGYLATEGEVIVVTFNYRVGVLGFLSTGTSEIPGNFGLLDQVEAMRWVQKNIERFGGDPKKVTIFGESAGGASVALHMLSPLSYGLYNQVILQSGTAVTTFAGMDNKTAVNSVRTFAKRVGCDVSGLKECLMKKSVGDILTAQENITGNAVSGLLVSPVVDDNFLHDHPFNLLVNGKFIQIVPAMIGVTKNDGGFFVLQKGIPDINKGLKKTTFDSLIKTGRWAYNQTQKVTDAVIFEYTDWTNETNQKVMRQKYMDVISDALFKAPAVRSAKVFAKHNIETYFYSFDHFVSSDTPSWAGVFHGVDRIYVFGKPFLKYNKSATEAEQDVELTFSKQIISKWSSFAKNGKPTEDSSKWPAYTVKDKHYISLGPTSSVKRNMLPGKMAFWNSLVSSLTEPEPTLTPIAPPTTKPIPVTLCPTGQNKAFAGKKTENALIAVVVILSVAVLVLLVVTWRIRRKLGDSHSNPDYPDDPDDSDDPGPTTRLI